MPKRKQYQDYKEWEDFSFPIKLYNIQFEPNKHDFNADFSITITRDENFKLRATLEAIITDVTKAKLNRDEEPGSFIDDIKIIGWDQEYMIYELHGCAFDSPSYQSINRFSQQQVFSVDIIFDSFSCKPVYGNSYRGNPVHTEWFICGSINILFPNSTHRSYKTTYVRARGEATDDTIDNTIDGLSMSRDYLSIVSSKIRAYVCKVPTHLGPDWAQCIAIEYYSIEGQIPEPSLREAVASLVGFIFGSQLLLVGFTLLNDNYIVEKFCIQPRGDNIRIKCSKPSMPPIFLNRKYDWGNIEKLMNRLIQPFLTLYEILELNHVLVRMWLSKEVPIGVNLPILSSAIDLLCKNYLSSCGDVQYVYMAQKDYLQLVKPELEIITQKLAGVKSAEKIINKIKTAYNRGSNEKIYLFFDKLGLAIGEMESKAIRARNFMAHGKVSIETDEEVKSIIKTTHTYQTLFNRILLKLLDYEDYYIDYSQTSHPLKKIAIPTGEG